MEKYSRIQVFVAAKLFWSAYILHLLPVKECRRRNSAIIDRYFPSQSSSNMDAKHPGQTFFVEQLLATQTVFFFSKLSTRGWRKLWIVSRQIHDLSCPTEHPSIDDGGALNVSTFIFQSPVFCGGPNAWLGTFQSALLKLMKEVEVEGCQFE